MWVLSLACTSPGVDVDSDPGDTVETDDTDIVDTDVADTDVEDTDIEDTDVEDTDIVDTDPPGEPVSTFSLIDANPGSLTFEMAISPRDYLKKVAGFYFTHAT